MTDRRFFVYDLIDPRDGSVFYVGKGTGNRPYQHVREARLFQGNAIKGVRIRSILASGHEPRVKIVVDNLTESEALILEGKRIRAKDGLTNIANGAYSREERDLMEITALCLRIRPFKEWWQMFVDQTGWPPPQYHIDGYRWVVGELLALRRDAMEAVK